MKVQNAMSEFLGALGFEKMATDVLAVADSDVTALRNYARITVKNLERDGHAEISRKAANLFRMHKPSLI